MSTQQDDLNGVAELAKMDDELSLGGEGEGTKKLVLRRSEMQVLRRMANRIPITGTDREVALACTMDMIHGDFSPSHKLTALRVFATFDKLNVEEMKTYVAAKIAANGDSKNVSGNVQVNVSIVEQVVVREESPAMPPVTTKITEHVVETPNGRDHH